MAAKRISDEPAYVLHRYDWSESSLILEVFTRTHGRVALVARGAKKPSSSFRPILLPLQPLHLAFGGDAEIRTLKSAEWQGGHVMPTGDALLSGYYLNELLMRLLARDDPHPALFDAYAATVQLLANQRIDTLQVALRAFELRLLRDIGLREAHDDDRNALSGAQWLALQQALDGDSPFADTMHACVNHLPELKHQLRALLHYHCDVKVLKTRQMMIDLQAL